MSDSNLHLQLNRERFEISEEFLEKYNRPGPRYTSYPTAPVWQDNFGPDDLEQFYATANAARTPVSLYMHLPFCESLCLFCACNVVITKDHSVAPPYIETLEREIEHVSRFVSRERPVVQFHWGGGTPTYLTPEQMEGLFRFTMERFTFAPDAEIGIEIDPRVTTQAHLESLRRLGFNRLSMGIQDFHPEVQLAIHRVQPLEMTRGLIESARQLGFDSINVDLIYGLPLQTAERFAHTVEQVVAIAPDRVAMFSYAHVPWLRKQQGALATRLPEGMEKFHIFRAGLENFLNAGYQYIGMDHFARPDDELAVAQHQRTLHRNFQGYTTKAGADLYGMGVSAISGMRMCYAQNDRDVAHYRERIESRGIATMRGYRLTDEDLLRRTVINRILCHGVLINREIEQEFGIDFNQTFAPEIERLAPFVSDGLIELENGVLRTTLLGRIFIRNIAMVFDPYLEKQKLESRPLFQKLSDRTIEAFLVSTSAQTAYPVLVVGAGISGLACAYHLQQAGIPVNAVEAATRPGGVIATKEKDGFHFDLGPQSFLTTEPLLKLIDALGLKDHLQHADPRAPRYILLRGQLVTAPMSPPSLFSTPLFSRGTKWRLLTEIARRTQPPAEDESIATFVRRKFGPELLERLVAPFVSGVYAGDPERLSMRASFPKIHEFESQYGSVLRGAMNSRPRKGTRRAGLCSFRDGMETLPRAIAARLVSSLHLETNVTAIRHGKANGKPWFEIDITRREQHETLAASAVVLATPTQITSQILENLSDSFAPIFSQIEYAPVTVLSACYRREQFQRAPDGFGFLVPRTEGLHVLGTVFNSSLFAGRAPEGMVSLTSFSGGATDPKFCELSEPEITETICGEVARVLGIKEKPVATNLQRYARALPQYNLGHSQIIKSLETLTESIPGLFLAGNYLSGPSIGSSIEQAFRTADAARIYLASIGVAGVGAVAHA